MNLNRNEQGYAMLIVLFLVTFIMIVSATFVSASVSNAKQEKTVDNNNIAVVAAEMGVDYYKTAIINNFNTNNDKLIESVESEIELLVNKIKEENLSKEEVQKKLEEIQENFAGSLTLLLRTGINNLDTEIIINNARKTSFNGEDLFIHEPVDPNAPDKNVYIKDEGESVIVKGSILGTNAEKDHLLEFEIEFILPDIMSIELDVNSNSNPQGFDFNVIIPDDIKLIGNLCPSAGNNNKVDLTGKICRGDDAGANPSFKNLDNSTVYYPKGYKDTNSNNPDFNGSKIYSDGDIDIKNMNSMSDGFMYVNGNLDANNLNGSGIANSKVIVGKSMTAIHMKVDNSKIAINNSLTTNHLTVENGTKICVGGKLTVNEKLEIDNNSSIYVLKTMNEDANKVNNDFKYKQGSQKVNFVDDVNKLWGMCGFGSDNIDYPKIDDNWKEPIIDVIY